MLFDFTLDGTSFFVMIFSLTIEIYITSGLVWLIGEWVRLGGCSFAVVVGGGSGEAERERRALRREVCYNSCYKDQLHHHNLPLDREL
jgi:hypothetical protein